MSELEVQQVTPVGYKHTDAGAIPEDWNCASIGSIASVSSGGTPNRKTPNFWNGTIPWVTTSLINGCTIFEAEEYITEQGLENSSAKWVDEGAILMAMYGQGKTRGKVGILGIGATINQACAAIQLKNSVSKSYVLHTLNSLYDEIRELSNSGGQENLSSGIVKQISIPLPPIEEQTAIANALSDVDALISELEKLIAKKQAIKTAAMQQLLTGKTRLPQFALRKDGTVKGTRPSELGDIPEGWEVIEFGELFESSISRPVLKPDKLVTFLGMQNVSEQAHVSSFQLTDYKSVRSGFTYFQKGDVLVAKITPCFENGKGAHTGTITTDYGFGSTEFHVLRATDHAHSKFIYYITTTGRFRHELESEMVGSAGHRRVPFSALQGYRIPAPLDEKEQDAISAVLTDMDTEIQTIEKRLSKTRHIKQGMMQELLTGKTRLLKPEETSS